MTEAEVKALGFLTRSQIQEIVTEAPGSYWYIFGEANRYGYITGTLFAPVFHYIVTSIKEVDPTAKIVSPSVLNWTWTCYKFCDYESGKDWLEEFIQAYESKYSGSKPPVDVWAIDVYPIDWSRTPNSSIHASIAISQLENMRQYLNSIPEYTFTPIWITEIAVHVGYDGWTIGSPLDPVGIYHWDKMSDYLTITLDWLEDNALANKIEKWFFFTTWKNIVDVGNDGYMGIFFFDGPQYGAKLNCLGKSYRARSLGKSLVKCDIEGNSIPEN
jgi:hypothetical protein